MAPPESTAEGLQPVHVAASNANKPVHVSQGVPLQGFAVKHLNNFHYATAATVKLPPVDPVAVETTKHTTQGVDVEPYTIVDGPQDWKAADLQGEENAHKWQYRLTEEDIAEIEAALQQLQDKGVRIEDLSGPEDFPLPSLGPRLVAIRDEVISGKGLQLIRGFPVHKFTRWQTAAAYYAFGLYWGKPQAQNAKGHILGHIKAIGTDPNLDGVRPYTTNIAHGYHTDNSDIAALLCLQEAAEGGVSNWVSSIAIHNELLRRGRRDLVEALATADFWLPAHNVWGSPEDRWDEQGKSAEWVNQRPFLYHHNRLSINFKEGAYYYIYKFPHAPKFTPLQEEALRTFVALAQSDELRLDHRLQPGDISILNNLTMLHAKTAFKDHTDPSKGRHLLRLWVAAPNAPELPEGSGYERTWGTTEVGDRGGYWLGHNYVKHAPLDAEYGDLEATRPKHLQQQPVHQQVVQQPESAPAVQVAA